MNDSQLKLSNQIGHKFLFLFVLHNSIEDILPRIRKTVSWPLGKLGVYLMLAKFNIMKRLWEVSQLTEFCVAYIGISMLYNRLKINIL